VKQMKHPVTLGLFVAIGALLATPAQAQFNGSHTLGDFGVQSGTQPAPGAMAVFPWSTRSSRASSSR